MKVAANERKLAELMLYIAARLLDDPKGGATKINKILFEAEFAHMRVHGKPITGVEYQRLPQGPAPRRLLPVREVLVTTSAAELRDDRYLGYPLRRLVPLREPDIQLFTEDELRSVDEAIDELWTANATEVSERSHREVGWRMVEENETIPYEAAYLAPRFEITESMRAKAAELADRVTQ